jgi:hypothetical protein
MFAIGTAKPTRVGVVEGKIYRGGNGESIPFVVKQQHKLEKEQSSVCCDF